MSTEDVRQAEARAQSLQRLREKKANVKVAEDKSPAVKAYAINKIVGHDKEGLPTEAHPGDVFDSTEAELKVLKVHGVAREATDEEIAAAEELSDEADDPDPSGTDEFAEGRPPVRDYHEYKHDASTEGDVPDEELDDSEEADDIGDDDDDSEDEEGDDVASMKKPDVIAELKELGYEVDSSAKVDDLRAELVKARKEKQ